MLKIRRSRDPIPVKDGLYIETGPRQGVFIWCVCVCVCILCQCFSEFISIMTSGSHIHIPNVEKRSSPLYLPPINSLQS